MVKNMKGWRVGRGHEMTESVLKKDNHCLGGKNKQISIEIYLLPVEITIFFPLLFFYVPFFRFSHFSFDNHSWVDFFFSQGE